MNEYARIIVDLHHQKVDRIFTYKVPEALQERLSEGSLVKVPFGRGNRTLDGYVIGLTGELSEKDREAVDKIKPVLGLAAQKPLFDHDDLVLAVQMAKRYMAPLSSCLSLFIPKIRNVGDQTEKWVVFTGDPAGKLGRSQQHFLDLLHQCGDRALLSLIRKGADISSQSLKSLENQHIIRIELQSSFESEGKPPASFVSGGNVPVLNPEQKEAVRKIVSAMEEGCYQGFLLHGITGSGKTEVYMHCIQKAIDLGRQALMLVPEISLTPQLIDLFTRRFGSQVGVTHSKMTDKERSVMWEKARKGFYRVVIGPRSALFTPLRQLGLVILDEEHEPSYRSEQMSPHYHARDVAEMLCRNKQIPMVLGSATPSIETYFRTSQGRLDLPADQQKEDSPLTLLTLSHRAVRSASLPRVELVDMRRELAKGNTSMFCDRLAYKIRDRILKKEQTILFLNRKGYATFVNCRKCGFVLKCPNCNLPYTYHKEADRLICHHCGKEVMLPKTCPVCGSKYIRQFGVGTERVEEACRQLFPDAGIVRMDMGTMKKREDYENVYKRFRSGQGDILIGTQMVAKGFDFPGVTLVGVLAADSGLYESDFHCTERTFQLLTQVAGRAGRADKQGEVLIQTYSPDHYCIQCVKNQDYREFYHQELEARRIMECPPFTHLAQILVTGPNEGKVRAAVSDLGRLCRRLAAGRPIEVLGPSPASLTRINNVFRYKLLVKCREEARLRAYVSYCLDHFTEADSRTQIFADIDPLSLE